MSREGQAKDDRDTRETEERYEIRLAGALEEHWQQWFEGMTLQVQQNAEDGTTYTVLIGSVKDQPALHGLLAAVRDLNLTLISVRRVMLDRQAIRRKDKTTRFHRVHRSCPLTTGAGVLKVRRISETRRSQMNRSFARPDRWLWLTYPIAILMAVAAAAGLFSGGLYRDNPSLRAQAIGQDLVTLLLALPALLISAYLASRGSLRARLVWFGLLIYVTYTYASYAFGIRWNPLFLCYVALLGCSAYALIGSLATVDRAAIKAAFTARTPNRAVGIFLLAIAGVFYLMWLSEAVPASLAGTVPQSVQQDGTPTNVIHVLDMGLLLPGLAIAAVSLLRKRPLGYTLSAAFLVNLAFLALAVLSMAVFQAWAGEPAPAPMLVVFIALFGMSIGLLVWYLRSVGPTPSTK